MGSLTKFNKSKVDVDPTKIIKIQIGLLTIVLLLSILGAATKLVKRKEIPSKAK